MRPIAAIKIFDGKQTPKKYVKFTLYDGNVVTLKSDIGDVLQPKTGSNIWNPAYSGILDSSIASQATDIVIKKLATSIGSYAFYGSSSYAFSKLATVNDIGGTIQTIGTNAFRFCSSLTTASFPNATSIGTNAFRLCSSLTTASFPNVTSIGSWAFAFCTSLTSASFPKVTSIGAYAFASCTSLTSASFPNVTSIGNCAFQFCKSLTSAPFPKVTSIGTFAFYNCTNLTTISFPNSTSIGECAFYDCPSLITASFPNVTSIGEYAFAYCASLTTASFPNVTSIGSWAFKSCTRLNNIYFTGSSIPSLANSNAFSNVATNCRIYVAESLYDQYLVAANWSLVKSKITPYIV